MTAHELARKLLDGPDVEALCFSCEGALYVSDVIYLQTGQTDPGGDRVDVPCAVVNGSNYRDKTQPV